MYLPAASCTPSFCQDTLKNQGLQPSPEYSEGVALALIRKVCASKTAGATASITLVNTMPVTRSTRSFLSSRSISCLPVSAFC